ncbi:MAG: threonylcarbamoyl-AMP synthase [Bacteroidales bacterium]|nr:threonylcarbamoyl-AMP synthase [Bacteroidales bacterium]
MQQEINKAIDILRKGGVILYPTDTIWGIGCDATNSEAVEKIYKIKQRAESKAMLVLINDSSELDKYVESVPDIAYELIDVTVKPLTIIYDDAIGLASNLIASDGSVGIRVTKEEFSNQLCKRLKKPIVSTSANISGEKTPATFREIDNAILDSVDYVVNYRQDDDYALKSSEIIKLSKSGTIKIIRK